MTFATKCWSCGSKRFQETVSREYCPDCGIECNYHGSGPNDKYRVATEYKWKRDEEYRRKAWEEENPGESWD